MHASSDKQGDSSFSQSHVCLQLAGIRTRRISKRKDGLKEVHVTCTVKFILFIFIHLLLFFWKFFKTLSG